jgi:hypothetical protein
VACRVVHLGLSGLCSRHYYKAFDMSKSKKSKWIRIAAVAIIEIAIVYIVFFAVFFLPVLLSGLFHGA